MLPTFVIGLREGLEASLIVGIVAAFLQRNGRADLLRWALLGVALAVLLCGAGGVGLYLLSEDLPQKQQEGLETVVGVIAVGMVTYMVVWMKRHSRDLKAQLEGVAGSALAAGSAWALVGMAFLAVLREGFETAVFLVAAFNGASNRGLASGGALLGIAVAVALGYGIYRGGVRINLSKFFRVTGVVLVLVAAGLVQTAFRTAHEAGWVNVGQQSTVDLSGIIDPGSVQSALITGMLGIQPQPKLIEFVAWLLYLVPLGLYVVWRPGKGLARRTVAALVAAAAVVTGLVAGALVLTAPALPGAALALTAPVTTAAGTVDDVRVAVDGDRLQVTALDPVTGEAGAVTTVPVTSTTSTQVAGVTARVLTATLPATTTSSTLTFDQIADLNGGRLPLGVRGAGDPATGSAPATTTERTEVSVAVAAASEHIVEVTWSTARSVVVEGATGTVAVAAAEPVTATLADAAATRSVVVEGATGTVAVAAAEPVTATLADAAATRAVADARAGESAVADRSSARSAAALLGVVASLLALAALVVLATDLRRRRATPPVTTTAAAERPTTTLSS